MGKHKVHKHFWIDGNLKIEEEIFDSLEDAVLHLMGTQHHGAKIHDHEGRVVQEVTATNSLEHFVPTYA